MNNIRFLPWIAAFGAGAASASAQIEFGPPQAYGVPGWGEASGVALGDIDRDGDLDMAVAATYNPVDGRITVFTNDGAGNFGAPVSYPAGGSGPTGVVFADLDRDGWPDLAYSLFSPGSSVRTLINNQAGQFTPGQTLYSGNATHLAAGDLSGDGWPDVVSTNSQVSGSIAKVFLNNGAGSLTAGVAYAVAGAPRSVTPADLDGDLDLDLAVPSLYGSLVSVLRNTGDGGFAPMENYPVDTGAWFAAAADLDGDLDVDLAVSSTGEQYTSDVSILRNLGNGSFAPAEAYQVGYDARGIAAADFDGDGDCDLAVVVKPQARIFVLANDGDGTFAPPLKFVTGEPGDGTYHLVAGDVNGDGRSDLVAANAGIHHGAVVLMNLTVSCAADCDGSGGLDVDDFICFQTLFGSNDPGADCDNSGELDIDDFICFQTAFGIGCG